MNTRLRYPKGYQFFDANGAPLALGNLYYYAAGTTTPLDTYTDAAGTVANTNPIVLDGSGRLDVDVYLGSTSNYKEVLTTASSTVAPWPDDNIPLAAQADWNATSGPNQILNKPALAAVATSGSYTDLSNTPATNSPFTGDSGSGGTSGLVPAPAAGDALANMFLSAGGGWATPPGSAISVNLVTSAATASGSTLTFASVPTSISAGMVVSDSTTSAVIPSGTVVSSTTETTVTLSSPVAGAGVLSGGTINFYGSASFVTNLTVSETANSVSIGSSNGSGVTIPAATSTAAGVLDSTRAATIDGLATVATSGSYSDLSNKPLNMSGATSSASGLAGFVPPPSAGQQGLFLRGDATWAAASGGSVAMTGATSTAAGSAGIVPAPNAGQQGFFLRGDATWEQMTAAQVSGIPASLASQNLDSIARLGIGTTDTGNALSVNAPSVLFSNSGDMRATISKGASSNTAAFNFQDNFSTRAQFGLLGSDNFTISTSLDGSAFNSAIVATPAGAVSFPSTGGFTGDSGSGGTSGLVPAPAAGTAASGNFLKADGTWQQVTAAQVNGLAPSATSDTTNASNITSGTLAGARVGDLSATYLTVTAAASEYAPLASPGLTGTPTAPTQLPGNNSTALATTAYLDSKLGANNGIATLSGSGTLSSSQIPASLVGAVVYQGTWNASTNTPALASGAGTRGYYYKVSVAGATAIDGNSQWNIGDTIIFDGSAWDKINGAEPEVLSVAGLTGAIGGSALSSALGLGSLATLSSVNLASMVSGNLPVGNLNSGTNASSASFWRGDGTWAQAPGLVSSNITYNINPAGTGDFSTIQAAYNFLANEYIGAYTGVTLQLANGTYAMSSPVNIFSNLFKNISIQGTTYSTTLSSIASSSGSMGNFSVVLNVASAANIAVGDYVAITGCTGGTNPAYIAGCWPVTAVSGSTITVTTSIQAGGVPSGSVTGVITVLKAVLSFAGCDGFDVYDGASVLNIKNVAIVGNHTANTYGLNVQECGRVLNNAGVIGINGFFTGAFCNYDSNIVGGTLVTSNNTDDGVFAATNAVFDCGITSTGNYNGSHASLGGVVSHYSGDIVAGNQIGLYSELEGRIFAASGVIVYGNGTYGTEQLTDGYINSSSATVGNNGTYNRSLICSPTAAGYSNLLLGFGASVAQGLDTPLAPLAIEASGTGAYLLAPSTGQNAALTFGETVSGIPTSRWSIYKDTSNFLDFGVTLGTPLFRIDTSGNLSVYYGFIYAAGYMNAVTGFKYNGTQVVGAQQTGYGTPTNGGIISSFPGSSATLAQCGQMISQIVLALKTHGLLGA